MLTIAPPSESPSLTAWIAGDAPTIPSLRRSTPRNAAWITVLPIASLLSLAMGTSSSVRWDDALDRRAQAFLPGRLAQELHCALGAGATLLFLTRSAREKHDRDPRAAFGQAALDIESIVRGHIKPLVRDASATTAARAIPREHYRWFVLGALACLVMAVMLGVSPARSKAP